MTQRYRFGKALRLTRKSEFERVRAEGSVLRGEFLTVAFLEQAEAGPPARAGFITSKRVGNAVTRNRARRRLREIFRKHQHGLRSGTWIVTIISARAARVPFAALQDEWLHLLRRASILAP